MTAKEFLKQYGDCERLIQAKERRIRTLREQATNITQSFTERVQSSGGGDRQAKTIDAYVDMEREVEQLRAIQTQVRVAINGIADSRQRIIADACYLDGMSLKEAAKELKYSYDHVRHVHVMALKSIKLTQYDT